MTENLPSWRPGATRQAIVDFVEAVTAGPEAIAPEERVAVFDNDGTLWTEKPMPTQLHFIVQQWIAAATADPSLADRQPYRAAVSGELSWLGGALDKHYAGDDGDLTLMVGAIIAHRGVEEYEEAVAGFYRDAEHLTLDRPYSGVVYQPMIELLDYLRAHDFAVYIVSGGSRDFMRPITMDYYGIPP